MIHATTIAGKGLLNMKKQDAMKKFFTPIFMEIFTALDDVEGMTIEDDVPATALLKAVHHKDVASAN